MSQFELLLVPHCALRSLELGRIKERLGIILEYDLGLGKKALVDVLPIQVQNTAIVPPTIKDDIYGELHFLPQLVFEAGSVYQDQIFTVELWNATERDITFDDTIAKFPAGSALDLNVETLEASTSRLGTLYVYVAGPATTNAAYTIVSSVRSITVHVTASRVIILPVLPNWARSLTTEYEIESVVEQNSQFYEQRRPLTWKPRRKVNFSVLDDFAALQTVRNMILYGDGKTFLVPLYEEPVFLLGAAGASLAVANDIENFWNLTRLCDVVVVHNRETKETVGLEVLSVNAATKTITLTRDLAITLDLDATVIFPAFVGVLTSHKPTTLSSGVGSYDIEFEELAGEDQPDLGTIAKPPTLFPYEENWASPPAQGFTSLQTLVGYPGTAGTLYSKDFRPPIEFTRRYTPLDRETSASLIDFFCYKKGRVGSFWIRGVHREFEIVSTVYPDAGSISVSDNGYLNLFDADEVVKIYIVGDDGTIYDRIIKSVFVNGPGTLQLNLDSTLGVTVEPGAFVGKVYFVRLGIDTLEMTHLSDAISKTDIKFFELRRES